MREVLLNDLGYADVVEMLENTVGSATVKL